MCSGGLEYPLAWISTAVEGTVNRIKRLKMYGRAKPDLLRRLILLA